MGTLETATWGLVGATFLLVVAGAVPAAEGIGERRERKKVLASDLIPDMQFLRDRMEGSRRFLAVSDLSRKDLRQECEVRAGEYLELLAELLEKSRGGGMPLVSEFLVCRHLVTQALITGERASELWDDRSQDAIRERGDLIGRCVGLYLPARLTLEEAEKLLPKWATRINKRPFSEEFKMRSREREARAEKILVDERYESGREPS